MAKIRLLIDNGQSAIDNYHPNFVKKILFRVLPADVSYKVFEPIKLQLVNQLHLLAELALGKAFAVIPNDVMFGQIDKIAAFILAKRHFCMREFEQLLML